MVTCGYMNNRAIWELTEEEARHSPSVFETRDVVRLVPIPLNTLNKMLERPRFGILPSVRAGSGRGSRRLFATPDVYGIALVWWLMQSGLRSRVIGRVLGNITGDPKRPNAVIAAGLLLGKQIDAKVDQLLVMRRDLQSRGSRPPPQTTTVCAASEIQKSSRASEATLILPVGKMLMDLRGRIEQFKPGGGGI